MANLTLRQFVILHESAHAVATAWLAPGALAGLTLEKDPGSNPRAGSRLAFTVLNPWHGTVEEALCDVVISLAGPFYCHHRWPTEVEAYGDGGAADYLSAMLACQHAESVTGRALRGTLRGEAQRMVASADFVAAVEAAACAVEDVARLAEGRAVSVLPFVVSGKP